MKRSILLIPVFILMVFLLNSDIFSKITSRVLPVDAIMTHITYTPCSNPNWNVTVSRNGGGFTDYCLINGASCKCVVNNPIEGYYTITVDNGSCTGTEYNVYYGGTGSGTLDVYVDSVLDCYR